MLKTLLLIAVLALTLQAKPTYMIVDVNNQKFSMKVSLANFGYFQYGYRLVGRLQVGARFIEWGEKLDKDRIPRNSTEKLQKEIPDFDAFKNATHGCKHLQQFNEEYVQAYGQPIYLVTRGNCTFVQKATTAAKYGKMLIIADDSEETDVDKIIMADDLSGKEVPIPVVMVSKKDGDTLLGFINQELKNRENIESNQIWITITFNKPQESEVSAIQYWMLPSDRDSYSFLSNHTVFLNTLIQAKKVSFQPHFIFYRCDAKCKEQSSKKGEDISSYCIQNGAYCHPDPDGKGPLSGVDSIRQTVKEMCINHIFPEFFLSYLFAFNQCYINDGKTMNECDKISDKFVKAQHLTADTESFNFRVNECVISEMNPLDVSQLLEKDYTLYKIQGLRFYPALFANGDIFKGDLKQKKASEEFICKSIEDTRNITVCDPYQNLKDDEDKFNNSFVSEESSHVVIIVCCVLFVAFLVGLFMYRRKIKMEVQKELTMQVDAAIQQYYALNESK